MFNRIDASKSTKGASKLRRDLINAEIANLRDLLPLPPSTRQRLSQLQLMALVCVFLRKANYFQQALKSDPSDSADIPTPNIGFSKAMSGFIMMMTQQGKLLYISENAAEYLGHSMEDLLIHGDSVYDVVDKQDHTVVENQLARNTLMPNERRLFLCRINVSRNSRRQLRFGDQKVVLVEGHYLPFVPLCNRSESVFLASCTPVVLPETRESVVQGATNIFTTIHSMDMKYLHIDKTAESHLEYARSELVGASWYNLVHWESIRTAYCKHQTVIQSDQERTSTALLRLQNRSGRWFWIHCVLQVKETSDECQQPIIVCTNQVLSDREAEVMRSSPWLYRYSAQSKFTYGLCPPSQQTQQQNPPLTDPYGTHDYPQQQQQQQHLHHHHHHPQNVQMSQQQQHRNDLRSESGHYPVIIPGNDGKVGRRNHDEIEPVDMSINSTADHDNTKSLYQLTHSLSYSSNDHQQQLHEMREGGSPVLANYHRGKSTIIQYSRAAAMTSMKTATTTATTTMKTTTTTTTTTMTTTTTTTATTRYSGDSPVHRYSIIDLDVAYSTCGESCGECCIESRMNVNPSPAAAARRIGVKDHQQADGAMMSQQQSLGESNETSMEHHWNCSSPPVWSDALQRVPDVAHQDLSPYITTPTTPVDNRVDTPDSAEIHSQVAVFNFEWSTGEQHVPVSKVIVHGRKMSDNEQRDNSPAATVAPAMLTLHLPNKRKNHSDAPKD